MATDDTRRIGRRAQTVGQAFAVEASLLHQLPDEPFNCARLVEAEVDAKARICMLQPWYSVPVRLARRRMTVRLGARHQEVCDPTSGTVVARHPRGLHKGSQGLDLDHDLEILARKPGALAGPGALAQARANACSPTPTTAGGPRRAASTATSPAPGRPCAAVQERCR